MTTSPKLRMALIGCGFFAQNHLHAWTSIPEVEIVAVCDRDAAKAEAARQSFGAAHAYTDAADRRFRYGLAASLRLNQA